MAAKGGTMRRGVTHLVEGDPERVSESSRVLCCGRPIRNLNGTENVTNDRMRVTCPGQISR